MIWVELKSDFSTTNHHFRIDQGPKLMSYEQHNLLKKKGFRIKPKKKFTVFSKQRYLRVCRGFSQYIFILLYHSQLLIKVKMIGH